MCYSVVRIRFENYYKTGYHRVLTCNNSALVSEGFLVNERSVGVGIFVGNEIFGVDVRRDGWKKRFSFVGPFYAGAIFVE